MSTVTVPAGRPSAPSTTSGRPLLVSMSESASRSDVDSVAVGALSAAPFPGGGPSIQSVVAGHTPICIQAIPPAMELVRAGRLRALGLTAKTRSPALPDVPTFDELGITNQESETMQGVLVPAATPKPILDLLQAEIARIVRLPDVNEKMLVQGLEPGGMSSAEFAAYIKDDIAKWKKVITDAKIPLIGG